MPSSGKLRRVGLVTTEVFEEISASIIIPFVRSVRRLLVTANIIRISPILFTLMMEEIRPSETSAVITTTLA
jgi:hypothetical protein